MIRPRIGLIASLAVIGALALPLTAAADTTLTSAHRHFQLTISGRPAASPIGVLQTWRLSLRNPASGRRVAGARITVDGDMPAHGHGLPTQPRVRDLGGGRY